MIADFTVKQGDSEPILAEQIIDSAGNPVDLAGATVNLRVRSMTASKPLTLTGQVSVPDAANGKVQWQPSTADTAVAGMYMANWVVVYANGAVQSYPTDGYIWISIEQNLTTEGGQTLVGLPEVKDYLNIPAGDRQHDEKLIGFIDDIRPIVEEICGPIIPQIFDEWHDGGQSFIQVRRRPQSGYGTSPILELLGAVEYRGPIPYTLSPVSNPATAGLYSVHIDALGRITRRTTGGGVIGFPSMPESVHITYRSGQLTVPGNVRRGTLELIRTNYRTTQPSGRGFASVADLEDQTEPAAGFFVPRRVRELLSPTRRAPAIA